MSELELTPRPPPCLLPVYFGPLHLSKIPVELSLTAITPFLGFDARFFTVEQQISYLLQRTYKLEEEFKHVNSLLFFPSPPQSPV